MMNSLALNGVTPSHDQSSTIRMGCRYRLKAQILSSSSIYDIHEPPRILLLIQ